MLTEKPWLGYFLGLKDQKFQLGIESKNGSAKIEPLKRNGEAVNIHNPVTLKFEILETTPDGKVVTKEVKPETLSSTSPATENPKAPVTVTGKTTGDAAFEYTITPETRGFSVSGRVTDKGTLTNPLTFSVSAAFAPYGSPSGETEAAKEKFEKKIKRDDARMVLTDGKREKIDFVSITNPATSTTVGISSIEIRTDAYDGVGFAFAASGKSKITFQDKGEAPLWKWFTLRWSVNEGADPTKEKLTFRAQ